MTRLFFAADVHGSEVCWKKFIRAGELYKAGVLILGGDMIGGAVGLARKRIEEWMAYADEKLKGTGICCYVCPGNDDPFEIDAGIAQAKRVQLVEGQVIALDHHHDMISTGWSNVTPWHTHRECSEEELTRKIEAMTAQVRDMKHCVFNFHAPAYGCGLDEVRPISSRSPVHVGSRAVRQAIEQHQPLLALFGHIHEGGGTVRIGRTLCINPGSVYQQGVLRGALIQLNKRGGLESYTLTTD